MGQYTKPIHLYFDRNLEKLCLTDKLKKVIEDLDFETVLCRSWAELPELLKWRPKSISFCQTELEYSSAVEIVNLVSTLSKFST